MTLRKVWKNAIGESGAQNGDEGSALAVTLVNFHDMSREILLTCPTSRVRPQNP
jgi:hypothetical protein